MNQKKFEKMLSESVIITEYSERIEDLEIKNRGLTQKIKKLEDKDVKGNNMPFMGKFKNRMCDFMLSDNETIDDFFVIGETSKILIGIKQGSDKARQIYRMSIIEGGSRSLSFSHRIKLNNGKSYRNCAIIHELKDTITILKDEKDFPLSINKEYISELL
jgi:hypothetical protein